VRCAMDFADKWMLFAFSLASLIAVTQIALAWIKMRTRPHYRKPPQR
jgi:hypothetical protein